MKIIGYWTGQPYGFASTFYLEKLRFGEQYFSVLFSNEMLYFMMVAFNICKFSKKFALEIAHTERKTA